ncbi:mitochondrial glutamate carrier 1 isoform X2 [Nematostella vectensis]|nr:mitochondrial glutamate carrier 1 isoform X2 [Nematostella vectensis]
MEKPNSFSAKLLNGAIAGMVGVTCTFPLDLCKTRLQNQGSGQRIYKNFLDVMWKVVRNEGPRGLYKGMGVNVVLVNPEKAIKLAVNDQLRQKFGGRMHILPLHLEMIAGAAAGCCQVAVTTPMEMLKIQMQMAGRHATTATANSSLVGSSSSTKAHISRSYGTASVAVPRSAFQIAKDLLLTKGISGIYKGLGATLARDIPFSCIYFPLFAYLNLKSIDMHGGKPPLIYCLGAGCLAGMTASVAVNPLDVIKTRLQLLNRPQGEPNYNGIIDCAKKIYSNEGLAAFYKGAVPRMIVIAPLFGIAQTVYFVGVAERILGVDVDSN